MVGSLGAICPGPHKTRVVRPQMACGFQGHRNMTVIGHEISRPHCVRRGTCTTGVGGCRPGPPSWLSPPLACAAQASDAGSRLRRSSVCRFLHDATTALARVDCWCSMDTMGAAASRVQTVGAQGACCWMWWGLGRGPFTFAFSRAWWLWDLFFHNNHGCPGRFPGATAAPVPPRHFLHSSECRADVDTDNVRWLLIPAGRDP